MDFNQDSNEMEPTDENSEQNGTKQWLQDNLRIIVSIVIVLLIAGGIYSYSKRSEVPAKQADIEESGVGQEISSANDENNSEEEGNIAPAEENQTDGADVKSNATPEEKTAPAETSQETENSFIQTATKGDGQTKLARKALANFLEKNPDSSLSAEHKIYIEDYLRKKVQTNKQVTVGMSMEFQKSLIQEAIAKSKTLNENQLKNLHKYAVRVPSLS